MSCSEKVFKVKVGTKQSHLIQLINYDLTDENLTIVSKIVDGDNNFIGDVIVEPMDQTLNLGVATVTFDATTWSQSLVGLLLKFDILFQIDNPSQPDASLASPTMYIEVLSSPTFSALSV